MALVYKKEVSAKYIRLVLCERTVPLAILLGLFINSMYIHGVFFFKKCDTP